MAEALEQRRAFRSDFLHQEQVQQAWETLVAGSFPRFTRSKGCLTLIEKEAASARMEAGLKLRKNHDQLQIQMNECDKMRTQQRELIEVQHKQLQRYKQSLKKSVAEKK